MANRSDTCEVEFAVKEAIGISGTLLNVGQSVEQGLSKARIGIAGCHDNKPPTGEVGKQKCVFGRRGWFVIRSVSPKYDGSAFESRFDVRRIPNIANVSARIARTRGCELAYFVWTSSKIFRLDRAH